MDGSENFSIIRWNTNDGKITRPVSKVDNGYIAGARSDCGYPIYRLAEIVQHLKLSDAIVRIYVCEGEKATTDILTIVKTMVNTTLPETEIVEAEINEVYPWHPLPVDILPETVARFIHEVSAANGCDPTWTDKTVSGKMEQAYFRLIYAFSL